MNPTTRELLEQFGGMGLLLEGRGLDRTFNRIVAVEDCGPGDLVFVDKEAYVEAVRERRPAVVVTSKALKDRFGDMADTTVLVAASVSLAHALIRGRWGGRRYDDAGWPRIHPSAVVHETAVVDETAVVEPRAVVGRNAVVGARTRVMAGAVIEHDAKVGADTVIHPNAVVGYGCVVGNEVSLGAGCVLGSEGFGFAQDRKGRSYPIPQTGIVVVEDRVRLGANCCVDRATYRETRIRAGTKMDNLCHVAHNVDIGEDCLMTAMFCVAGSTVLGKRLMASGPTTITDHVTLCDNVVLVHRAGVTKSIHRPGVYGGGPVQPMQEYMRNMAAARTVVELRKRVQELEKRCGVAKGEEHPPSAGTGSSSPGSELSP